MEFKINKFFEEEECESIIKYVDDIGIQFAYNPLETWDCKRIYDEEFKQKIVNRLLSNYQYNKFKVWFDLNKFDIRDVNISLTKYYDNRWLDLHLDSTSQFTTVIVLSNNFIGGEFVLSNSYTDIKKCNKYNLNIGESISFDGSKLYHGVSPVTNGIRYALNIWMTNTDFKYKPLKKNKSII